MVFGNQWVLWLLMAIPPILFLGFWGWKVKKEIIKIWMPERDVKKSQIKKYILAVAMVSFLILAFSSPKIPLAVPGGSEKQGGIILMVDVSGSMAARESPDSDSRLERVKPMLYELIDKFPEARFYPFHFTGLARSLTPPLTKEDFPYLKKSIARVLDVYSAPGSGSSIGNSILQVLGKIPEDGKTRIIVLFSDGEFFAGLTGTGGTQDYLLENALKKAFQENVKIVTVGVGEKDGAKIPLYNEEGEFTGDFAQAGDKTFVSYLEEETLQLIASETRGEYFSEKDYGGVIDFLNKNLDDGEIKGQQDFQDMGYLLLIPVALLWIAFVRFHFK